MKVLIGFVLGIVAVIVGGIVFIYSGVYNVAAVDPHNPVVSWALEATMHRSVAARADGIAAPARFDEAQVRKGAENFSSMCAMCHGGPGVEPSEVGKGLRPDPPELGNALRHLSTAERFWIVKHGIKMTGMPGFGATHSDEELWAIVGFLDRLPTLSAEEYRNLVGDTDGGHGQDQDGQSGRAGDDHEGAR